MTPQYNRSFPAPIKNAIDYLFAEWDAKPIAARRLRLERRGRRRPPTSPRCSVTSRPTSSAPTGLVFTQDVTPEGELTVGDERRAELAGLLDALSARLRERQSVSA